MCSLPCAGPWQPSARGGGNPAVIHRFLTRRRLCPARLALPCRCLAVFPPSSMFCAVSSRGGEHETGRGRPWATVRPCCLVVLDQILVAHFSAARPRATASISSPWVLIGAVILQSVHNPMLGSLSFPLSLSLWAVQNQACHVAHAWGAGGATRRGTSRHIPRTGS